MYRSFTNRVFGGVCGGLGETFRLNPWLLRAVFIVLSVLSSGLVAVLYVLLWWVMPQDTLTIRGRMRFFRVLFILALATLTAAGWIGHDRGLLQGPDGQDLLAPGVLFAVSVVFLLRQVGAKRRNLMWGLVLTAVSLALVLNALGYVPEGIYDIIDRAWPALLVLAGLSVFLRDRMRFGNGLALVVSVALVGGMATLAFSTRSVELREDYQEEIEQVVDAEVDLLQVNVEVLATDVEFRSSDNRTIVVRFLGSTESTVTTGYEAEDARATFTLREEQLREFPMLQAVGRGRLVVELPPELPVDVAFGGMDGEATFNMGDLFLERLNINLQRGDAIVTIPVYNPLSPTAGEQAGNFTVEDGDVTIFVPGEVAARMELNRGGSGVEPVFDPLVYNHMVGDVLEARAYDSADIQLLYVVTAPRGLIRLGVEGE